jgi:RimJ/RimL family protein N-acetyltransferase
VAQRLGFVFEGTLRNSAIDADGTPCDRQIYALVPDDYARLDWGRR